MQSTSKETLFLIPLPISEIELNWSIPLNVINQISKIQCFIVENAKVSRHFLKQVNPKIIWDNVLIFEMDKHQIQSQNNEILNLMKQHRLVGLMSDAGLPCIADPGNHVVRIAHENGITVKPLIGPSSIILALIASGLNGQSFKFHGYLPSKPEERKQSISALEKICKESTQLFIEAPYRNEAMFSDLLKTLSPETRLLIASDICGENEYILCKTVKWWLEYPIQIGKIPCMFAIGA
jgi:16S rRNA (cytidine1402-2'-O)-methyltransferase